MICRIRGLLIQKSPPFLMVEAGGLGYELEAPLSTFYDLPECGQEVILLTHFVVKEDQQTLFAFQNEAERELFRKLLKISGVGGKLALAILSAMQPHQLHQAIVSGDVTALTKIPGIGKKTAERLVLELKDKLDAYSTISKSSSAAHTESVQSDPVSEACAALEALGYKPQEASRLVAKIDIEGLGTEAVIRKALALTMGGARGG